MMERVTTITAAEWDKVAEDVKAGRCEVSREEDFSTLIKEITASYAGGYLRTAWYPDPKSEVSIIGADDVLYVRWPATAQTERDVEAGEADRLRAALKDIQTGVSGNVGNCVDCNSVYTVATAALQTTPQPAPAQSEVTGSIPDDELIDRILVMLGVDPSDWSSSLSGIYAAIRSNMQIGEPHMSNVYDWTDGEINVNSLTEAMFKLLERAQRAEAKPAPAGNSELVAAVKQVIALAPDDAPEYPEFDEDVPHKYVAKDFESYGRDRAYRHVKQILAAALKGE